MMANEEENDKEKARKFRMQIREMLNKKFYETTKIEKVAYQAIESGQMKVRMEGWPTECKFNRPSNIGMKNLQKIWEARDSITFVQTDTREGGPAVMNNSTDDDRVEDSMELPVATTNYHVNDVENISSPASSEQPTELHSDLSELETMIASTSKRLEVSKPKKIKGATKSRISSKEDFFTAEEVLQFQLGPDGIRYLVKWKDYPHSENTWEPEENLMGTVALKKFTAKYKKAKD